jgi:hypothetical protein
VVIMVVFFLLIRRTTEIVGWVLVGLTSFLLDIGFTDSICELETCFSDGVEEIDCDVLLFYYEGVQFLSRVLFLSILLRDIDFSYLFGSCSCDSPFCGVIRKFFLFVHPL